jgi:hypothetical protein
MDIGGLAERAPDEAASENVASTSASATRFT